MMAGLARKGKPYRGPDEGAERRGAREILQAPRARGTSVVVSTAITEGISVNVRVTYVPEQSAPRLRRYVFAYTIRIANEGSTTAQLKNRHWIITDGDGRIEEVKGPGVVGKQPTLRPGDQFEYTSGCVLTTPRGEMRGTYEMHRPDGTQFEATIAPFELSLPYSLN